MRNIRKKIRIALLFALILLMVLPIEANAATQPKLSHKKLTIYAGVGCGTKTITVKGLPEGTKVTWKTSNKKIATVKNGVITPKKSGKVTITAQVQGKKLSCKVTVKPAKVYVLNKENGQYNTQSGLRDIYLLHPDGTKKWYCSEPYDCRWCEWEVGKDIPEGQYKVVEGECWITYGRKAYINNGLLVNGRIVGGPAADVLMEVKKGDYLNYNIYYSTDPNKLKKFVALVPIKYINSLDGYDPKKEYNHTETYKVGRDIPEGRYVYCMNYYENVNIYGKGDNPTPKEFIKQTSALGKKNWGPDVIISNSLQEILQLNGRLVKATKKEYMAIKKPGSKMISYYDFGELLKTAPYVNKEIELFDPEENPDGVKGDGLMNIDIGVPITLKKGQWIHKIYTSQARLYPEPAKFILNAENKTLKKGKSFQLKVKKFEPKGAFDKVIYSSSNKKIATVDEKGKVVAKQPGTAVITVQCPTNKKIKATCLITVPSDKKPTPTPTKKPTVTPTAKPSETPTPQPTMVVSVMPTVTPGTTPTEQLIPTTGIMVTTVPTPTVEDSLTGLPTITPVNTTTPLPTATVLPDDSVEFFLEDGEFLKYTGNGENIVLGTGIKSVGKNAFENCTSLKSIGFSDEVTKIDDEAFLNCINLSTVKFSTGLTSIGNYAFSGCSVLDNVELPSSLKSIGSGAFKDCENLRNITIPVSIQFIPSDAFSGCDNLKIYCSPGSYAETYAIENSIPYENISDME